MPLSQLGRSTYVIFVVQATRTAPPRMFVSSWWAIQRKPRRWLYYPLHKIPKSVRVDNVKKRTYAVTRCLDRRTDRAPLDPGRSMHVIKRVFTNHADLMRVYCDVPHLIKHVNTVASAAAAAGSALCFGIIDDTPLLINIFVHHISLPNTISSIDRPLLINFSMILF